MKRIRQLAPLLSAFFLLSEGSPTEEPTESPTVYCYGPDYTDKIGEAFIECAKSAKKALNVTIHACDPEDQIKLEFAIANKLYDQCWRPHCVYFSMELAFRWKDSRGCYEGTWFGDNQCWEESFNKYYKENQLRVALDVICHDTAAPTWMPTQHPSLAPTYDPTQFPTQWCHGAEYTEALGEEFITCGSENIPFLTLEACNEDVQDELYFAIANKLYDSCSSPWCVYVSSDYAFSWNDDSKCWNAVRNNGMVGECFEERNNDFIISERLHHALSAICSDTAPPTWHPTSEPPTTPPTRTPSVYCYGEEYNNQMGDDFITCALEKNKVVLIEACEPEDQVKLEFAIANELYEKCSRPWCLYFSMELAFRWRGRGCYEALLNTGDQVPCWDQLYNSYYESGELKLALDAICFDTATPTINPSPWPTRYCDGTVYNETLGATFLACRKYSIPELEILACDSEFQEDLEFGIANGLFSNCSMAECVYSSLDYAFRWNDNDDCYEVFSNGIQKECWEESDEYWTRGNLEAALEVICFDRAPTSYPTIYPTQSPSETPTANPTQIPTSSPTVTPTQIPSASPTVSPTAVPTQSPSVTLTPPTGSPTQWPSPNTTFKPRLINMSEPSRQPTHPPTSSVLLSIQISGITEAWIEDTIAPLARAVNISEEFISIERWSDVGILRRLVVSEFLLEYLIQVLQRSDLTELLAVINADNFADDLIGELAYELKIPRENLNLTIESVEILVESEMISKASYDPWTEIALVLAIFLLFMLLVGIVGAVVRQNAQKEQVEFEEMKNSGDILRDRTVRNEGLRTRKRRGVRISCCSCLSEECKKSLCPCAVKKKKSGGGNKTQTLLTAEEIGDIFEAGMPTLEESKAAMVDGKECNFEATMLKIPEAGQRKSEENRIEIIPSIDDETATAGMPLPTTKGATETEAQKGREALQKRLPEEKIGIRKRKSQMIDDSPKERSDSHGKQAQKTPPPATGDKGEFRPSARVRRSSDFDLDSQSEGAHTVDFSNLEQKATSVQINSTHISMNTTEHSSQREQSVTGSHKESVKGRTHKRRDSNISTSSRGGKYGNSVTATL